jgi:hypothetical protein
LLQDVNFTADDQKNAFIPQLWATRRVGWLLDEIRMHGESAELKDEVVQLARTYGIVTPYTAYLIMEDEHRRNVTLSLQSYRELNDDSATRDKTEAYYKSAPAEAASEAERSGKQAVANAQGDGPVKRQRKRPAGAVGRAIGQAGHGGIQRQRRRIPTGGLSCHHQLRPAGAFDQWPGVLSKWEYLD